MGGWVSNITNIETRNHQIQSKIIQNHQKKIPKNNQNNKIQKKKFRKIQKYHTSINFHRYIRKILHSINSEYQITLEGIEITNNFLNDILMKIIMESSNLVKNSHKKTLQYKDIESACKLILPGQIREYAIMKGNDALSQYKNNLNRNNRNNHNNNNDDIIENAEPEINNM